MSNPTEQPQIATSSVEEGLDFACSLLTDALVMRGEESPNVAKQLLTELASYLQLRYVGETGLALEYLAGLGQQCAPTSQFWNQLRWVAVQLKLNEQELAALGLPNA